MQVWVGPEQEAFSATPALISRDYLLLLIDLGGNPRIRALCQAIGMPTLSKYLRTKKQPKEKGFGAGYPADTHVDVPEDVRGKSFSQALDVVEK